MDSADRIVLIPRFRARPERRAEFAQLLRDMAETSGRESGCLEYAVHIDPANEDLFVLYELWADRDALDAHDQTQHVKEFLAALPDLLAEPFSVDRLRPIGEGGRVPG